MADLISRQAVMELIESKCVDGCLGNDDETLIDAYELLNDVSDIPTAYDVEQMKPRKPEHVIYYPKGRKHHTIYCGVCGAYRQRVFIGDKYCRECGTKIDWRE